MYMEVKKMIKISNLSKKYDKENQEAERKNQKN